MATLRGSSAIQDAVEALARRYGVDLYGGYAAGFRLEQEPYTPLEVKNVGLDYGITPVIVVGHYVTLSGGRVLKDPEIVFWTPTTDIAAQYAIRLRKTAPRIWIPIAITQILTRQERPVVNIGPHGKPVSFDYRQQNDVAYFANIFGKNIVEQGWIDARVARSGQPGGRQWW